MAEALTPTKVVVAETKPMGQATDARIASSAPDGFVQYLQLCDFLNLDNQSKQDPENREQMKYLYSWAGKKAKSDNLYDVLMHLKDVEHRIGYPAQGQTRLGKLYYYAKIDDQADSYNAMRKDMERGY